jgi:5-methylcytosine-specific restriction endonuclease McrA
VNVTDPTRPCVVCGESFQSYRNIAKVCSPSCRAAHSSNLQAAWYAEHRNDQTIIDSRKRADAKHKAKVRADPELAAKKAAALRAWRDSNVEHLREYDKQRWVTHRDQILQKIDRRRARKLDAFVENVSPLDIWYRDFGICGICNEPIDPDLRYPDKQSMTLDHIVALSNGGKHEAANIQLAHAVCNCRKGNRW